jgi:hypothetical protein
MRAVLVAAPQDEGGVVGFNPAVLCAVTLHWSGRPAWPLSIATGEYARLPGQWRVAADPDPQVESFSAIE